MKRLTFGMMVLAATVLAGAAWAEQDKVGQPVRLEVQLVDGSRVMGVPALTSMTVDNVCRAEYPPGGNTGCRHRG